METRFRTALEAAIQYLKNEGLIQKNADVAKKLDISEGRLSSYISGSSTPSKNFIKSFETSFGIKINDYQMYTSPTLSVKGSRLGEHNGYGRPQDDKERIIEELKERVKFLEEMIKEQNELIKNLMEKK